MVDKYSTRAPSKDTEERMVFHMSCDTTQHRALETTHCVGRLMNCKQTSRGRESSHEGSHKLRCTSQRERSHLRRPPSLAPAENSTDSRSQWTNVTTRRRALDSQNPTAIIGVDRHARIASLPDGRIIFTSPTKFNAIIRDEPGPNALYFARREFPQTNAAAVADASRQCRTA